MEDDGATTLLVSELVTNVVAHARTSSVVTLAVAGGMIEVGVADAGVTTLDVSPLAIPAHGDAVPHDVPETPQESGRGLMIVEALSHDWGVVAADGSGTQVWFRRSIEAGWRYAGACACRADAPAAQRLASGRSVVAMPGPWDRLRV